MNAAPVSPIVDTPHGRSCTCHACPTLSERIESACALAARLYAEGADTTAADAEVERLFAIYERTVAHV